MYLIFRNGGPGDVKMTIIHQEIHSDMVNFAYGHSTFMGSDYFKLYCFLYIESICVSLI